MNNSSKVTNILPILTETVNNIMKVLVVYYEFIWENWKKHDEVFKDNFLVIKQHTGIYIS